MKKLILSAAFIMATVSFAVAQFGNESMNPSASVQTEQQQTEWKAAKVTDLSVNVQAAIKAKETTHDVKTILYNATTKEAKVTFITKADKTEKTVVYDEQGKEVVAKKVK